MSCKLSNLWESMDMDNSVVILGERGVSGLNGNGKNAIKIKFKEKENVCSYSKNTDFKDT